MKYGFEIDSYVVMPEHVHLLVSDPARGDLSLVMQALKVSVARRMRLRPFWQHRFYDFNVFTDEERVEIGGTFIAIPIRAIWSRTRRSGPGRAIGAGLMARRASSRLSRRVRLRNDKDTGATVVSER